MTGMSQARAKMKCAVGKRAASKTWNPWRDCADKLFVAAYWQELSDRFEGKCSREGSAEEAAQARMIKFLEGKQAELTKARKRRRRPVS